ncbi:MAG: pyridoxal phosphate-dependent aminotransferase [Alphaproteobacteria bacterium]|nr:MAG: pyridoxal phosphate-dependent aminotransferase [Alphaproteobacteria bacterium]
MQPSLRIRNVAADNAGAWDLYERARARIRAGEDIVMLTVGDHDWTTPEPIIAEMALSARAGNTGYPDLRGTPELRAAIAARIARETGVPTGPDQVQVTTGGQGALFAAAMATLDPGDRALILAPYYATYPDTVRAASGLPTILDTRSEDGFEPRPAALAEAAAGCRMMLVNSPHNPTGAVYGPASMQAIADVATGQDLWVVSDEVYATQVHDGRHLSPRALPGMADRTLVVGSLSKAQAMTGFRIGWLVGLEAVMARVADLGIATTYGVPGFIQDAALWALTEGAALEAETRAVYARRRQVALAALAGARGLRVLPPRAGMYVFLDIRATGLSGRDFALRLLEEEAIAVMPGESFGRAAAGHVRVALTVAEERLDAALRRLAALAGRLADGGAR